MIFNKNIECMSCNYKGDAAKEATFCPMCISDNIMVISSYKKKSSERINVKFANNILTKAFLSR